MILSHKGIKKALISMCAPLLFANMVDRVSQVEAHIRAMTCDFHQFGILTSVDSDEPVQPPLKLRN